MQSEKLFDQAVQLAAAFVANGDIRLQGRLGTGKHPQELERLGDLIAELYEVLHTARDNVIGSAKP